MSLSLILLIVACILFFVAALPIASRVALVPLGLFFWTLSILDRRRRNRAALTPWPAKSQWPISL